MEVFLNPDAWIALLTLTFLEIILGIDNIIFISIVTGKLPVEKRKKATKLGMFLAMFMRIALLFGINFLIQMKKPWFHIDFSWFSAGVTGQSLILLLGGLFLIYKSTKEIHEKVDEKGEEEKEIGKTAAKSFQGVLLQIIMIDLVFSFDSILNRCRNDQWRCRCSLYYDYSCGDFGFYYDAICCSCWEFCKQSSFYPNSWIILFDSDWFYADYRKCSFIQCVNLWKPRYTSTKRLFVFCHFLLLLVEVLNMKMDKKKK